jgi:hypothetical protein
MSDCRPASTPLPQKPNLSIEDCPSSDADKAEYRNAANGLSYLEIIGCILYATQTRPDVAYGVNTLAQYGSNPGKKHMQAAKHLLRYLRGTSNFGLTLGGKSDCADLIGWTDSDWAANTDTRRSVGGFVFDVAGGSILWSSKKQPTVALSTVEAEYMASSNATKECIWLRTLLEDMGFLQTSATILRGDNQGAIALSYNPVSHSRAKHIDICHHFIRGRVASGKIVLEYVSTQNMLADIFTKQLPHDAFEKFWAALGVREL